MLALFDVISDMFFSPRQGVLKAAKISPKKTIYFYLFFLLLVFWTTAVMLYPTFSKSILLVLFGFKFFLSLAVIFAFTALLNSLVDFFYHRSVHIKELFSALIFSLLPFSLLPLLLKISILHTKLDFLSTLLCLWSFILFLFSVKKLYGLGLLKSLFILVMPFFFIVSFYFLFFMYMLTFLSALLL